MLDEFQEIIRIDPVLPGVLRSVIQAQQHVAYLFLGSQQHLMTRVFTDRNQPLYRSARPLPLGPIAATDFAPFIRSRFESTQVWIEDATISRILEITAGHPHDTQELCHFTWEVANGAGTLATPSSVETALRHLVEAEDAHYTTLWDSLTRPQRAVVQALVREPGKGQYSEIYRRRHQLGSPGTVQKSLATLLERGAVEGSSLRGYSVPDVFFRAWIQTVFNVP